MSFLRPYSCWLCLLCLLSTYLSVGSAQLIVASNGTSMTSTFRKFTLEATFEGVRQSVQLDPLTGDAGAAGELESLRGLEFFGPLILVNSPDTPIEAGDLPFIRCDVEADAGRPQVSDTVSAVLQQSPGAVVLYSVNSTRCRAEGFMFSILYTTTDPVESALLEETLRSTPNMSNRGKITLAGREENSGGSGGNGFMRSPTTAVAMIILYSITGIITALFLIIIVVGAIRAHRHPERYGPRRDAGRPRQSRAKGIARAMLETIPIVKFGDHEDKKPVTRTRDVELETGVGPVPAASPTAQQAEGQEISAATGALKADDRPDLVMMETAAGAQANAEKRTDNGLACSVCTDDFVKGQDIRVLPCNHKYHPECIDPWLLNVSGTCPMCRIDLRPITSHPQSLSNAVTHGDAHPPDPPTSAEPANSTPSDVPHPNRRSRAGLSLYIQNTLNWRRMHDATPEERIAALRHLRTVNRTTPSDPNDGSTTAEPHGLRRLSVRLSRALGPSSRPPSGFPTGHAQPRYPPVA